eukprot:GILI01030385.1.p1 GENE.GILI01030385.1~~GILI01030385.1.p1  ORF type:complete len:216 (+),score=42.05 GILI01030385.1:42-689(+)
MPYTISEFCQAQPVHLAAFEGDLGTVRAFIATDPANATLTERFGNDVLYYAMQGEQPEVVRAILQENSAVADTINVLNSDGMTPLTTAATIGNVGVIQSLLVDGKADINLQNGEDGSTPLNCAIRQGHVAASNALLDAGASASPDLKNREDGTALHHAALGIRWEAADQIALIKRLIDAGGDIHAKNNQGHTPLASAEFYDMTIHPDVKKLLGGN